MNRAERARIVLERLAERNPAPETELHYENGYQLLVAVILSAQCTDVRVNLVTPGLFARYPTAADLAAAAPEEIYPLIKSVSYPNNKAAHLAGTARILADEYGGEPPRTLDELQRLPGVGRKTANVVASVLYGAPTIAVDTHVLRVSNRLGLADAKTPDKTEAQLLEIIPDDLRHNAHHWLILHGRYVCKARTPLCHECPLTDVCEWYAAHEAV